MYWCCVEYSAPDLRLQAGHQLVGFICWVILVYACINVCSLLMDCVPFSMDRKVRLAFASWGALHLER